MRSILTVIDGAESYDLVTLSRVKMALGISEGNTAQDANLAALITAASAAVATYLNRVLALEEVAQTFRLDSCEHPECLVLDRYPVTEIDTVTEGSTEVDESEYEVDAESGMLYRLTSDDARSCWTGAKIVVEYSAGYELPADAVPGSPGTPAVEGTLPADIQHAVIVLLQAFKSEAGRDPTLKAEEVPGVGSFQYWVGSISGSGGSDYPPSFCSYLDPYRRVIVA